MADGPTRGESINSAAEDLFIALLRIIRQNAQGHPIGHDAIVAGRKALHFAMYGHDGKRKRQIDWSTAKLNEYPEL